jgi:DNA-binding CsgD family transcriptional regulator
MRYREIFGPAGIGEDLRAALVADGSCWGYLALHRDPARPFGTAEARFVGGLADHLADGLRTSLLLDTIDIDTDEGPGIVLLRDDLTVRAVSPAAEGFLDDVVSKEPYRPGMLPDAVLAVVASLLQLEISDGMGDTPRARVPTRSGRWLVVHATRMSSADDGGSIGVVLEPARAHDLMPLILDAYKLTRRESEITQLVLQGRSTAQIATRLGISPLTVQQHLKRVFEKSGVRSRRELAARVFAQHYWPRMAAGARLAADGSFLDA